jgi:hypothetical protein
VFLPLGLKGVGGGGQQPQHSLAGHGETIPTTGEKACHSVYSVIPAVKRKQSHTYTPSNVYQLILVYTGGLIIILRKNMSVFVFLF